MRAVIWVAVWVAVYGQAQASSRGLVPFNVKFPVFSAAEMLAGHGPDENGFPWFSESVAIGDAERNPQGFRFVSDAFQFFVGKLVTVHNRHFVGGSEAGSHGVHFDIRGFGRKGIRINPDIGPVEQFIGWGLPEVFERQADGYFTAANHWRNVGFQKDIRPQLPLAASAGFHDLPQREDGDEASGHRSQNYPRLFIIVFLATVCAGCIVLLVCYNK